MFGLDWDGPIPPYLRDDEPSAVVIPNWIPWIMKNSTIPLLIVLIMGLIL